MTQPAGFGKPKPQKSKPASEGAQKRVTEAKQYDEMKATGMPEYEVFIRTQMNKQWLPVGAIAVRRSNQVNQAIYANEQALLQAAFHRMPILKKNRDKLEFEYGYRLKEYKDEPIELAVKPPEKSPNLLQTATSNVGNAVGNVLGNWFPKKSS